MVLHEKGLLMMVKSGTCDANRNRCQKKIKFGIWAYFSSPGQAP